MAKKLGTTGWSIRNWVQKFRKIGEFPTNYETKPEADELRRLCEELAQLGTENEIFKKAARYFTK